MDPWVQVSRTKLTLVFFPLSLSLPLCFVFDQKCQKHAYTGNIHTHIHTVTHTHTQVMCVCEDKEGTHRGQILISERERERTSTFRSISTLAEGSSEQATLQKGNKCWTWVILLIILMMESAREIESARERQRKRERDREREREIKDAKDCVWPPKTVCVSPRYTHIHRHVYSVSVCRCQKMVPLAAQEGTNGKCNKVRLQQSQANNKQPTKANTISGHPHPHAHIRDITEAWLCSKGHLHSFLSGSCLCNKDVPFEVTS